MGNSDLSNLSFNMPTTLPSPDQIGGNVSVTGQPSGTSTASTTTATGGATRGVSAGKGASTATGVNPLIIDQNVGQSTATETGISGMGMNAASILGEAPSIDPQSMMTSLGKVADDLDQIGGVINSIASDVSGMAGFSSIGGRVRGGEGTKAQRGDRGDGGKKAGGKGKGKNTAEGSSPSAGDSVSRSVSPTGAVTTTVSTQSTNSSGGVTNNTTTTVTGGGSSSSSQGSTSSTSSQSGSTEGTISMTTIMDEIGSMDAQESQTMAQQQTSEIDAVELQDKDSIAGANQLIDGADMMMNLAIVGLTCSMLTSAYQIGGIGSASKEGDEADMQSLDDHQESLENTSESTMQSMEVSRNHPGSTEAHINAQKSAIQLRSLARDKKTPDNIREQANDVANNVDKVSENVAYKTGGTKAELKYEDTDAYKQVQTDLAAAKKAGTVDPHTNITTPEEAVKFYQDRAKASNEALKNSIGEYKIALSGKGITEDQARATVQSGWSDTQKEQYQKAVNDDDIKTQEEMLDNPVKALQTNIANIKINRNSQAWQNAYNSRYQEIGIYANTGQVVSQVFNTAGNMESTIGQAEEEKDSASAQVQGSTEQAMSQGVQQTESLAEQLRQSQSEVAQDMQSMVSSTKV